MSTLREHLLIQHPFNYNPKASSKKQAGLIFQAPAFLRGSSKRYYRSDCKYASASPQTYLHGGMRGIQRLGGMPRALSLVAS